MSWLSDLGKSVLGVTTDLSLDKQKSWLEPALKIGSGLLKNYNADNQQSQYADYLKQRADTNYADQVAAINAYNQNAQAVGAASAANQAAQMAAAKKANRVSQQSYKKILQMYAPYKQTADTLLPQMSQTYQNSLGLQNAMGQFINMPDQIAKLRGDTPAYNVNVPLPDYIRMK